MTFKEAIEGESIFNNSFIKSYYVTCYELFMLDLFKKNNPSIYSGSKKDKKIKRVVLKMI